MNFMQPMFCTYTFSCTASGAPVGPRISFLHVHHDAFVAFTIAVRILLHPHAPSIQPDYRWKLRSKLLHDSTTLLSASAARGAASRA